jgi:small nuclear ribonucleoprotein
MLSKILDGILRVWIGFYLSRKGRGIKEVMSQQGKRPLTTLQKAINKEVSVRLKVDLEYRGRMTSVDPYMNVILLDATEYSGGNPSANYGKVVIRGNNVLFIRIANDFQV